ncbi:MAG: hypothetical protein VW405_01070 [Rhodospirillaceae bacterium]
MDTLEDVDVIECQLVHPKSCLYGMADASTIYIDPVTNLADTIVHELTHVLRPEWSERTVRLQTARTMAALSSDDIAVLMAHYRARRKRMRAQNA